jgi:hypothetical protein
MGRYITFLMILLSLRHENQSPLSKAAPGRPSLGEGDFIHVKGIWQLVFTVFQWSKTVFMQWESLFQQVSWLQVLLDQCWQIPWWEVQVEVCLQAERQDKEFTTIMPSIGSLKPIHKTSLHSLFSNNYSQIQISPFPKLHYA